MDKEEKTVSQVEYESVSQNREEKPSQKEKKQTSISHKVFTIIGIVLCVILIPLLIANLTMIIKSHTDKDKVPSFGKLIPLIVLTDSMYPNIKSGDLIFCNTIEAEDVKVGDVISFFDPANESTVITHRVKEIVTEEGKLFFKTRGDNNTADDRLLVPAENLVGIYKSRLVGLGRLAMFMQSTAGLIVCVVLPIILLVGYDVLRRVLYDRKNKEDTDALLAELEKLKAEKARKEKELEESGEIAQETEESGEENTQSENQPEQVKEEAQETKDKPTTTDKQTDNESDK